MKENWISEIGKDLKEVGLKLQQLAAKSEMENIMKQKKVEKMNKKTMICNVFHG